MRLASLRSSRISAIDREIERQFKRLVFSLDDSAGSLGQVHDLIRVMGELLRDDGACKSIAVPPPAAAGKSRSARTWIYMGLLRELSRTGRRVYLLRRRAMAGDVWDFRSLWSSRFCFIAHMCRLGFAGVCYGVSQPLGFRLAFAALKRFSNDLWPEIAYCAE